MVNGDTADTGKVTANKRGGKNAKSTGQKVNAAGTVRVPENKGTGKKANAGPADQVVSDADEATKVTTAKPDAENACSNGKTGGKNGTGTTGRPTHRYQTRGVTGAKKQSGDSKFKETKCYKCGSIQHLKAQCPAAAVQHQNKNTSDKVDNQDGKDQDDCAPRRTLRNRKPNMCKMCLLTHCHRSCLLN